ncbi:MAG TPA: hypothetical protein VMZ92_12025 [Planctomycetota bacterium]|nr:hypothetical protein [Planctomycetota bacterium]
MANDPQQCAHLDQQLRWLGVRRESDREVYLFQCTGCGKTLSTHVPLSPGKEIGPLMKLGGPASV